MTDVIDVALRERVDAQFAGHEKLHEADMRAYERAHEVVVKAIDALAEVVRTNKHDGNEWRQAMSDREARFASKDEADGRAGRIAKLEIEESARVERERSDALNASDEKIARAALLERVSQIETRMYLAIGALGVIFVFVNLFTPAVQSALHLVP